MPLFTDWNSLLLREYFSPAQANEDVWIQTSRNELDSFGLHLGGAAGLIEAVKQGPEWVHFGNANSADLAFGLVRQRCSTLRSAKYIDPGIDAAVYRGLKAPSYLPCLALWVLASSEAEEGFYAKVESILGKPFQNASAVTTAMEAVWKDLEHWSNAETGGRFGLFRVRVLGEHRFVGIPRSQCMVSRKDVNGVRQLFAACHLRPKQELTPILFHRILELGKDSHHLSNSLKYAMQTLAYHEPLASLLGNMLHSWDGRAPRAQGHHSEQKHSVQVETDLEDEITLKLAPSGDDAENWDIRWRFPASGQANECALVIDDFRITSRLELSGDCFTSIGLSHQEACRSALLKSVEGDVQVQAEYNDEGAYEVGGGARAYRIAKRDLRILVWDVPDPRLGEELVERDLPISGPLYLLCSSNFRGKLGRYLKNEEIANEPLQTGGLPSGWFLTCITNARQLSQDQREWLTDGNAIPESRANLRFVGGRPIIRGGAKLYAFYDLPTLEFEAPDGASPRAEGLEFNEVGLSTAFRSQLSIRRFKIQVCDKRNVAFEIKAMCRNEQLASVRLRVSIPDGTGVGDERPFGLDCLGRSAPSEGGLRGAVISAGSSEGQHAFDDEPMTLTQENLINTPDSLPQISLAAKFLDSLAQIGSIAYGAARDQICRLSELANPDVQPALLLLELRSRGHLEIQTDDKGHMIRIHAVPPTLYSLPVKNDGLLMFGVCGSLRLQHWADLSELEDCLIFIEGRQFGQLPVVRLAAIDLESMQNVARSLGFLAVWNPSDALSKWAGSLARATSDLSSWGWGSFSANLGQLQRLHPESARFIPVTNGGMAVDRKTGRQLFRLDDPAVPGLQVYVLGSIQPNETTSFSFIHDSRWGVWISISAFAAMLKGHFSIDDASPWPIHYDRTFRTFWFPARLRPPSVIERALVLCSGSGPLEVQTTGTRKGGNIELINKYTGLSIGVASSVYDSLASGIWLCYQWVPGAIAQRVAKLLGGEIRPFIQKIDVN